MNEVYDVRLANCGLLQVTDDLSAMTGVSGIFQRMAPEVMANQRYSVKADVYSFGMVLWVCTARQVCKAVPLSYQSAAWVWVQQHRVAWEESARRMLCDAVCCCAAGASEMARPMPHAHQASS